MFQSRYTSNSAVNSNRLHRRLPAVAITLFASAVVVRALVAAEASAAVDTPVSPAGLQTAPTAVADAVGSHLQETTDLHTAQLAQGTVTETTQGTVTETTSTQTRRDNGLWLARTRELMEADNRQVDEVAERLKEIIKARFEADQLNLQSLTTISELRGKIAEYEALLKAARYRQGKLDADKAALQGRLNLVIDERDGALDDLSALDKEIQQQLGSVQVLKSETATAAEDLAHKEQQIADLTSQIQRLSAERDEAQANNADKEKELADNHSVMDALKQKLMHRQAQLSEKEDVLGQLNGLVSGNQETLGLYENQLGDLKAQVNALTSDRDSAEAEVEAVERLLSDKADAVAALEQQLGRLSTERDNAVVEVARLQEQLADEKSNANNFLSQRDNLAGELSMFQDKAVQSGNSFVAEQQAHTQTRANLLALQREADELRRNIDKLGGEREMLTNETSELKASRAELNGQLLATKEELGTRQKALYGALSSIENLNSRIAELTSDRDGLQLKVDDLDSQVVALQASMTSAEKDYNNELSGSRQQFLNQTTELESEIASRDEGLELLKEELADIEDNRDRLLVAKQHSDDEIEKLLGMVNELTASRDESKRKVDELNRLNQELNAGIIESGNGIDTLQGQIADLSSTRDDYANKIAQLETLNQELESQLQANRDELALLAGNSGEKIARFESREALFKSNALEAADKILELANQREALLVELDQSRSKFEQMESELGTANDEISVYEAELNVAQQELRDLMNAQRLAEAERDRIAADAELLRVSLTEELNNAKLENIIVQNARADNSIPIRLGNADFFETGSARLTQEGGENLTKLAEIIHSYHDRRIVVEGHTDNIPIGPGLQFRYASNWELSVARAAAAVRHMHNKTDIDPKSLSAAGYGEFKPTADNLSAEGRRQNRRVEVVLYPANDEFQSITALDE